MTDRPRILIADSSKYFDLSMWRRLIPADYYLVGLAASTQEAVHQALTYIPHVIIVDLSYSSLCGLATIEALHSLQREASIVCLLSVWSPQYAHAATLVGAAVCVLKSELAHGLAHTLRTLSPNSTREGAPYDHPKQRNRSRQSKRLATSPHGYLR